MRDHHTTYDRIATERCERVLLTLLGDVGPWSERIYLAGGLAPRYLPSGGFLTGPGAHVGTTDVDLIIGLAIGDEAPETYRTLHNNLNNAGFKQTQRSFRWSRTVDGVSVDVEFLCETDQVDPGAIYRPREGTGSKVRRVQRPRRPARHTRLRRTRHRRRATRRRRTLQGDRACPPGCSPTQS